MSYEVQSGSNILQVSSDNNVFTVNGKEITPDIQEISVHESHVLLNNASYSVEILNVDNSQKEITLRINGKTRRMQVRDRMDILLSKLGMGGSQSQKMTVLKAPMPGKVLEILVEEGTEVQKGEPLLILEAMKMENTIKAQGNGIVKSVKALKGTNVEKGQLLIQFA